jgi:anti-anti-sigma factor
VQSLDDSGCHHIILDLGDLEHLDSAGMGMLLIARDRMAAKGGSVALRNAAGRTGRVLQLARFHGLFANDERNAQV